MTESMVLETEGKEKCLDVFKAILRTRYVDEKTYKMVKQNKGATFHLSMAGHELVGAVSALSLTPEKDWGLPYYRDRAFAIGLGCGLKDLIGAFLARDVPHHSGGKMMPDHFSHKRLRIPCQSSVVGSQFLQAVGVALSAKLNNLDEVVYVSAGDGATSQGDFHEALNFACIHKLSVVFVIQDNGWAISVPKSEQTCGASIADLVVGYPGLSVSKVDGCDFPELSAALSSAVKRGRSNEGPTLVVADVPRIGPHSNSDDPTKYKNADHVSNDTSRDPIVCYERWLIDMGLLDPSELKNLRQEIFDEVEMAAKEAEQIAFPSKESASDHLFVEDLQKEIIKEENGESVVIVDAINHALDEEMEIDNSVVVFGQDVARNKGGVFGVTRGLTDKYGNRCFNTPLAESTIVGLAIGLSLTGRFKPVAEIQFSDYMWTGINQLINELSSFHYRSNGEWHCPVVIRMPCGGYIQGGPYHSQNIEAFLAHCPGLKIVIPSNSADAKRMMKAAIRDPNPVIFLENKALYRQRVFSARKEPLPEEVLPLGKANIVSEGDDITIVAWSMMVPMAHEVSTKLEGISCEIIDLRTICPLDFETILRSVKKTGKLLILQEAPPTCGFAAEIAARVSAEGFTYLDAPIKRITALECMVPYSKKLEEVVLPQKEDIEQAIRDLVNY